jgi:RNA polymerase sigma-70 factor (ECF subfamily)
MKIPTNSLQRVAAGDASAVRECLDAHGDLVWGMVQRYGRQGGEAERAVEAVFAELWQTASFCPDGIPGELTFVATCVRRHLIRSDQHRGHEAFVDGDVLRVEQQLRAMSQEQQAVLGECLAQGYSPAEIASRLSLPPPVVRQHLRSGLAAVSAQLAAQTCG